jgi:predicted nucleic acid-binding protein
VVGARAGFLLDTNVISELTKARPNQGVAEWIGATAEELLFLSVITIGEVRKGIDLLDDHDPKRGAFQRWLDRDLRLRFAGRLLVFDDAVAERWGQLEALAKRRQQTLPTIDAQLSATALHHGLTLVTRNTTHVRATGVPLFNPWGAG